MRLTFAIGAGGEPIDVAVAESSGHMAFSLAAMRAVRQYRFRPEFLSRLRAYSLLRIASGVVVNDELYCRRMEV